MSPWVYFAPVTSFLFAKRRRDCRVGRALRRESACARLSGLTASLSLSGAGARRGSLLPPRGGHLSGLTRPGLRAALGPVLGKSQGPRRPPHTPWRVRGGEERREPQPAPYWARAPGLGWGGAGSRPAGNPSACAPAACASPSPVPLARGAGAAAAVGFPFSARLPWLGWRCPPVEAGFFSPVCRCL